MYVRTRLTPAAAISGASCATKPAKSGRAPYWGALPTANGLQSTPLMKMGSSSMVRFRPLTRTGGTRPVAGQPGGSGDGGDAGGEGGSTGGGCKGGGGSGGTDGEGGRDGGDAGQAKQEL